MTRLDCKTMTWAQMAETVQAIHVEMKRRNPIWINAYAGVVRHAAELLDEIAKGEASNFTSECGPKEPKRAKKQTYKTHWEFNRSIGAFCGASLSVMTTRYATKVSCETCRKLMKLHGHMGNEQ